MSDVILDRAGRLLNIPKFLAPVSEREGSVARLGAFVALSVALALLAAMVVLVAVLAVSITVLASKGMPVDQAIKVLMDGERPDRSLTSYAYEFSAVGLSLFAAAAAMIALAAKLYQRPMRSFITIAPRFRWKLMLLGLVVATPVIVLVLLAELSLTGTPLDPPILHGQGWADVAGYIGVAVVFLFLAALAEEMIFRGWLLQQTSAFTRNVFVILAVNGILFSLIHVDPDPGAFAVRAAMGAGWAWIALRLGGLEFGTGAHLANNLVVTLLVEPLTLTPPGTEGSDYRSVLVQFVIVAVTVAAVEWGVRRRASLSTGAGPVNGR